MPDVSGSTNGSSGDLLSPSNGVEPDREKEEEEPKQSRCGQERRQEARRRAEEEEKAEKQRRELSVLALLLAVLRKSLLGCRTERVAGEDFVSMEIGWPTDVRHVVHVTFDRFQGFLGLPVEFEQEIHSRALSASATVFGVSAEYLQCAYDSRGNSVPTILLLMQKRLYEQGGLRAEGIFRINAENSQEEFVRSQMNDGIVPEGIDVHCLAVLIKAWFRELPSGLLDSLSSEQVMQCQTEEDCTCLARLLPPTEAALLDWAINLMADVVQGEHVNKMNAHNIATVFAPNMTRMADPLAALMHAVQVINFLRMLIEMTLEGRQEATLDDTSASNASPSDENGDRRSRLQLEVQMNIQQSTAETLARVLEEKPAQDEKAALPLTNQQFIDNSVCPNGSSGVVFQEKPTEDEKADCPQASNGAALLSTVKKFVENPILPEGLSGVQESGTIKDSPRKKMYHLSCQNLKKGRKGRKGKPKSIARLLLLTEKSNSTGILSSINSKGDRVEAI